MSFFGLASNRVSGLILTMVINNMPMYVVFACYLGAKHTNFRTNSVINRVLVNKLAVFGTSELATIALSFLGINVDLIHFALVQGSLPIIMEQSKRTFVTHASEQTN